MINWKVNQRIIKRLIMQTIMDKSNSGKKPVALTNKKPCGLNQQYSLLEASYVTEL